MSILSTVAPLAALLRLFQRALQTLMLRMMMMMGIPPMVTLHRSRCWDESLQWPLPFALSVPGAFSEVVSVTVIADRDCAASCGVCSLWWMRR
jgi:hypothetical protein